MYKYESRANGVPAAESELAATLEGLDPEMHRRVMRQEWQQLPQVTRTAWEHELPEHLRSDSEAIASYYAHRLSELLIAECAVLDTDQFLAA